MKKMIDIYVKICVVCNTERSIDDIYNKNRECKQCNIKKVLKRNCNNIDNIVQKRRDKYPRFKDLDNRLKALEENFSENNCCFFVFEPTNKKRCLSYWW